MKKIVLLLVLFFNAFLFGQEYKTEFFDSLGMRSVNETGFRKIVYEKKDSLYKISTFYKGKLNAVKIVVDTINYAKNMEETEYFENGKISKTRKYLNNKLDGDIVEYYDNGLKKAVYQMEYDQSLNSVYKINEFWNKEGEQQVIKGNGKFEFEISVNFGLNEKLFLTGNVVDGLFEGKFNSNDEVFPYFEEYYSKGKLLNGMRKVSKKESKYYTEIAIQAKPNGGMSSFRGLIGSQMSTKRQKSALKGQVIAKFIVDTNGSIKNPIIVKSLNSYFDNQLLDILRNTEKWTPGEYRGLKVKQYFTIPLLIDVEEAK